MMRVKLADESWDFDEESMRNTEAVALQKTAGLKWQEVVGGLFIADPNAITALIWLCRRRAGMPDTENRISQLDFDLKDFDWEPIDEEGRVLRYRDGIIVSRDGVPEPGWDADGNPVPVDTPDGEVELDPTKPASGTTEES
jgi:hypothetical protein